MKTLKKLSAILLSVMILATLIPANFAFAETTFTPKYYDFEGYIDTSGTGKPSGFGENTPSPACTILPGSDSEYGTTVKVKMGASNKQTNLNMGLKSENLPTSKIVTFRTAIKNSDMLRAGVALSGIGLAYFGRDGYIYVGTTKTPYTYKVDTWYDLATTVNLTNGNIECVINGNNYTNVIACGKAAGVVSLNFTIWQYLQLGMIGTSDNALIYKNGVVSDNTLEIGYLSIYEGTFVSPEISFKDDFEDGSAGAYPKTTSASATVVEDEDGNKVLKVTHINAKDNGGSSNTYSGSVNRSIALPQTGKVTISFLAKGPTNTQRRVTLKGDGASSGSLTLVDFQKSLNTQIAGDGNSVPKWAVDVWHTVVFTLDMSAGTYSGTVTRAGFGTLGTKSGTLPVITGTPYLEFYTNGGIAATTGANPAYFDDICVTVDERIRLQHMDIAPGTRNVFVSEEPTVYFTEKIAPATVNTTNVQLTVNGVAVEDYTPEVGADGKSIVIKHTEPLAGKTKYTVSISNIASKDKSTDIAASYSYSFTTAKAYEIGDVTFSGAAAGEAGNVTANVNIKFNDNAKHEVAFILAAYDGESGELLACNFANTKGANAVEGSGTLTATVENIPAGAKVYAYLWDGLTTLRPYIPATLLQ